MVLCSPFVLIHATKFNNIYTEYEYIHFDIETFIRTFFWLVDAQ